MKVYTGTRIEVGATVDVEDDGQHRGLDPRFDIRSHSPTGFEWGYTGSGPAQLSLALAADVLGDDERAQDIYQDLKFKLISRLPAEGWTLTESELLTTIGRLEEERGRTRGRGGKVNGQ